MQNAFYSAYEFTEHNCERAYEQTEWNESTECELKWKYEFE